MRLSKLTLMNVAYAVAWVITVGGMVALINYRYPDNHGSGPWMFLSLFAVMSVAGLVGLRHSARSGLVMVSLALLGVLLVLIADRFNVMISY